MSKKYILSLLVVLTIVALFMISLTTINTKEVVGVKNNFLNTTTTVKKYIPPVNRKVVNIPDANFKEILMINLKDNISSMQSELEYEKPEEETEIYEDEMEMIIFLKAEKSGIKSISGLEFAKNLEYATLHRNEITDITPLTNLLKIKHLTLNNNKIKSIKGIEKLTNLIELAIEDNEISNISYIKNLNLDILNIVNNQTVTINPEINKFELGLYLNDGTKLDVEAEGLIDNNDGTYSLKDPNIGINFKYRDIFDVIINPVKEKEIVKVEEENNEVKVTTNINDNTNTTSKSKDGSLSSNKLPYAGTTTNILLLISIMLVIVYSNKVLRKQKLINNLSKVVDKGIRK